MTTAETRECDVLDGAGAMSVAFTAQTVESPIASGSSLRLELPSPEPSDFALLSGAFGHHRLGSGTPKGSGTVRSENQHRGRLETEGSEPESGTGRPLHERSRGTGSE